jgi:HAD superfamily hydrolase (TIGR01490 family)
MRGLLRALPGHGDEADGRRAVLAGEASAAAAQVEPISHEPDPVAAAFFDLDNTMMRGASIYYFARGLAARKLFSARDLARFAWGQVSFRLSGEKKDHMDAAREAALTFVAGHKVAEIAALGEEIYDELMADRIWEGTRNLAQRHLDAGQRVWLVTATPADLAEIIAVRLGFTGALGTVAESVDGTYTGRLVGEMLHGPAKAAAITALANREGLDLSRCSAYSDSFNDLPMLSLVGYPNAVNPDSELRTHARREGWPVHDFRTGRRATMIALPVAAGAGAIAGGVAAGAAIRKKNRLAAEAAAASGTVAGRAAGAVAGRAASAVAGRAASAVAGRAAGAVAGRAAGAVAGRAAEMRSGWTSRAQPNASPRSSNRS